MNSVSLTSTNRIVALVDMDCFYVQVEERDNPAIKGIPAAVVQYKAYKGGGIIAVNYEARAKGVTRNMRGDDAKSVCPEIILVRVPESRGKADLTKYRNAGKEVIDVLTDFSTCVERASIDEAYIDLTEAVELRLAEMSSQDLPGVWGENVIRGLNMEHLATNFVLGHNSTNDWLESLQNSEIPSVNDLKLAVGAEIVGQMRDAVFCRTSFRCSAGIAHNKVLAKLVCGINKPNKQTILPHESVANLWSSTKISKVRGLGGKLGEFVESLGCVHMSDLKRFTEKDLISFLGSKTGVKAFIFYPRIWMYQLSLGYDDEQVTPRQLPKSIGCNKNFQGPEALKTKEKTKFWITQLSNEVVERIQLDLETNNRRAKTLTLHVKFASQNHLSRSCGSPNYNAERMAADVYSVMEKLYQTAGVLPINSLGLIASKFEDEVDVAACSKINDFFKTKSASVDNSCDQDTSLALPVENSNCDKSVNDTNKVSEQRSSELSVLDQSKSMRPGTSEPSTVVRAIQGVSGDEDKSQNNKSVNCSNIAANQTPKKRSSDEDVRKPFFQFIASAPKSLSPLKSPRKIMSLSSNGLIETLSKNGVPEVNSSVLKDCDKCGKKIAEWDFLSHMDYHFAKDLSREINGLPAVNTNIHSETSKKKSEAEERSAQKRPRGKEASIKIGSKRGRPAKIKPTSTSTSNVSKTIDSYFLPKS